MGWSGGRASFSSCFGDGRKQCYPGARVDVQDRELLPPCHSTGHGHGCRTAARRFRRLVVCSGLLPLCFLLERCFCSCGHCSHIFRSGGEPGHPEQFRVEQCCPEQMMHLFINSMAASAGGGLTYIRNVIPYLASTPKLRVTIAMRAELREEFRAFPTVEFVEMEIPPVRRFWYEQSTLPGLIRHCHADVLLSTGNFALRSSP